MTRAELIEKASRKLDLSKKETSVVIESLFQSISDALEGGDKVELRGFGSFNIRHRNARVGRNPKSGKAVDVPAKKVPFFRAAKNLKKIVDGKGRECEVVHAIRKAYVSA